MTSLWKTRGRDSCQEHTSFWSEFHSLLRPPVEPGIGRTCPREIMGARPGPRPAADDDDEAAHRAAFSRAHFPCSPAKYTTLAKWGLNSKPGLPFRVVDGNMMNFCGCMTPDLTRISRSLTDKSKCGTRIGTSGGSATRR